VGRCQAAMRSRGTVQQKKFYFGPKIMVRLQASQAMTKRTNAKK